MSNFVRSAVALVALTGFLGATAFDAVTALHVGLEHDTPLGTASHAHHPGVATPEGHAHPHASELARQEQPALAAGQEHRTTAPEHDHALGVAASLQPRSDVSSAASHSLGPADSRPCADVAVRSRRGESLRASSAARAAPLSRRSVVLQV